MRVAMYKGKKYRLEYLGNTKFGVRAKLAFFSGTKSFWVAAAAVKEIFNSAVPARTASYGARGPFPTVPARKFDYAKASASIDRAMAAAPTMGYYGVDGDYRPDMEPEPPYQDEFDTYAEEAALEQRSVEDMELDQYRDEARARGEEIPF